MVRLVINCYQRRNLQKCQIMKRNYNKKQKILNLKEIKRFQNTKNYKNQKENN